MNHRRATDDCLCLESEGRHVGDGATCRRSRDSPDYVIDLVDSREISFGKREELMLPYKGLRVTLE